MPRLGCLVLREITLFRLCPRHGSYLLLVLENGGLSLLCSLANSIVLLASFEEFFRVHWRFSVVMADEVDDRFENILALFLDKDFGH